MGCRTTRLPGEVDAQQYNEVLTLAMAAQRSAKAVLAQARAGGQGLLEADWRLLAYYAWETDQQQLVGTGSRASLLKELAQACPAAFADSAMRLRWRRWPQPTARPAQWPARLRNAHRCRRCSPMRRRRGATWTCWVNSAAELVGALSAARLN